MMVKYLLQDIIQLHISCPSDKEEEKSSKDEYENEEKEKKDKTPRKMLSRGEKEFRAVSNQHFIASSLIFGIRKYNINLLIPNCYDAEQMESFARLYSSLFSESRRDETPSSTVY